MYFASKIFNIRHICYMSLFKMNLPHLLLVFYLFLIWLSSNTCVRMNIRTYVRTNMQIYVRTITVVIIPSIRILFLLFILVFQNSCFSVFRNLQIQLIVFAQTETLRLEPQGSEIYPLQISNIKFQISNFRLEWRDLGYPGYFHLRKHSNTIDMIGIYLIPWVVSFISSLPSSQLLQMYQKCFSPLKKSSTAFFNDFCTKLFYTFRSIVSIHSYF